MSEPGSVCDCASLCALPWSSGVYHNHHPPCTAPWLQEPGRIWGHGLVRAWGWWVAMGEEGGLGGGPCSTHSRLKLRGQGSPSSHPSDLCVRCLPAHPRGAARDAASLPGQPQAWRSGSQGPVTSQLSRSCKELSDELQHARTQEADRLVPRPRVIVEV